MARQSARRLMAGRWWRRRSLTMLAVALAIVAIALAGLVFAYQVPSTEGGDQSPGTLVWAVGDGADGSEAAIAVAETMADSPIDRLLYLGDVYETGTAEEFEDNYEPVYGRFAEITAPTIGNHEYHERQEGYFDYWESVTGEPQPLHYSFELAGWEVVTVNSEGDRVSDLAEARWLGGQLAEPGNCRLVFWHTPRYSATEGEEYGDDPSIEPLWAAVEGRAAITVHGDQHNMQRFEPIDGVTQFISGAGGHGLYDLSSDPRLAFGNDEDYGAVRFELEPGRAEYAFVNMDGEVLDSGTISCRPLEEAPPET